VSTASVLRSARLALRHGDRILARIMTQSGGPLTPALVARAAAAGSRFSLEIWRQVGYHLGLGLASLIHTLNPERIILGGGMAGAFRLFRGGMREAIRARAFKAPAGAAQIVRAQLGDRAGIVGAAMLVWEGSG